MPKRVTVIQLRHCHQKVTSVRSYSEEKTSHVSKKTHSPSDCYSSFVLSGAEPKKQKLGPPDCRCNWYLERFCHTGHGYCLKCLVSWHPLWLVDSYLPHSTMYLNICEHNSTKVYWDFYVLQTSQLSGLSFHLLQMLIMSLGSSVLIMVNYSPSKAKGFFIRVGRLLVVELLKPPPWHLTASASASGFCSKTPKRWESCRRNAPLLPCLSPPNFHILFSLTGNYHRVP